tara:strand:+ start:158 stop:331 length:174 start_codon:yes stop_codon:yes gene_type:complete
MTRRTRRQTRRRCASKQPAALAKARWRHDAARAEPAAAAAAVAVMAVVRVAAIVVAR